MRDLKQIAVVMDPLERVVAHKDSTVALMLAAQARGAKVFITSPTDLYSVGDQVRADLQEITLKDQADWYTAQGKVAVALTEFDVVLMRKDPPVDFSYIATTWLLDRVQAAGTCVLNTPQALRGFNEKLSVLQFADLTPPALVSARLKDLRSFLEEHDEVVIKPLDRMGGSGIRRVHREDSDADAVMASITQEGTVPIMAQKFLTEVMQGDRRLLLIDGELIPEVAVRTPKANEFRANLACGGTLHVEPANDRDLLIAGRLAAPLRQAGICFAGADVIGGYLTEINITSPTCIREIEAQTREQVSDRFWDAVTDHWMKREASPTDQSRSF